MRFLKTLFWVVLAVGIVLFARENWVPVDIQLWSGLIAEVKLPFLLLVTFLAGFLPTYLLYRGRMWTMRRQLGRPERTIVANEPAAAAQPQPLMSAPAEPAAAPAEPAPPAPTGPGLTRRDNAPGLIT